jgi:hypothetical protein
MPVGAPPQAPEPKGAARRATIAFALVGLDATAAERHRDRMRAGHEPAAPEVSGLASHSDAGQRVFSHNYRRFSAARF